MCSGPIERSLTRSRVGWVVRNEQLAELDACIADCVRRMRDWNVAMSIASTPTLYARTKELRDMENAHMSRYLILRREFVERWSNEIM